MKPLKAGLFASYESSDMSIDQARKLLLRHSLNQIAAQRHKISLEMATMLKMRRELNVMARSAMLSRVCERVARGHAGEVGTLVERGMVSGMTVPSGGRAL